MSPPPGAPRTPSPPAPRGHSLVDGEYWFTRGNFQAIAGMLRADAGIALPDSKATLVYSRHAKRLRTLGLHSFDDYCALVASDAGEPERRRMLTSLTTNVTRFFREPHHFEHLAAEVLPTLREQARRGGRVRLWSAACSTGQEPYSIAMTILAAVPDAADLDVRVLATDIDSVVLAEGRAGLYSDSCVAAVPPQQRQRWFTRVADGRWSVAEELRRLVAFRELNLVGTWPMQGRFQAIMCRNVVIYFDEPTQAAIWQRFTPLLDPAGLLYIGHSERLAGPAAADFESAGITAYRRAGRRS